MKRKIIYAWIVLILTVGIVWYGYQYYCYNYPFLTSPSGFSYKSIGRSGNGRKVKDGEWVELSLIVKVFSKEGSQKKGKKTSCQERILIHEPKPIFLRLDQSFQANNKPIAEMVRMMQEKQRMIFKCVPQYYLGETDPECLEQLLEDLNLDKEDEIVTEIKLDKIMTNEAYNQMLEERSAVQLIKDKQSIMDYLVAHHIEASSTDSGLFYIIDQYSQSTPVVKGNTITVHYTGKLLDGTIFDTSVEEIAKAHNLYNPQRAYKPLVFQVGTGCVIKGWDEGLLLLKKHEKARLFIPSTLAYGEQVVCKIIPKNSILLFEVEVVDVS